MDGRRRQARGPGGGSDGKGSWHAIPDREGRQTRRVQPRIRDYVRHTIRRR